MTDAARLTVGAGARVGKRARLVVAARADGDASSDNDSVVLDPVVIGVGDTAVRSRGARGFSGAASRGRGPLKPASLRVRRVEVAVRRLGGSAKKPVCSWLRSSSGSLSRGGCSSPRWVRVSGTSRWRLVLKRALGAGRYEIRSRATIGAGLREAVFSRKDGNLVTLRVR